MRNKVVKYTPSNAGDFLLNRMLSEKANGLIKKGVFTDEIVWGAFSYIIPRMTKKKQGNFKKGMFLFGMVKKDVKIYLENNVVRLPNRYGQIEYNEDVEIEEDERITGTDLNHAYWRIAYNFGIISESTYYNGLKKDEYKVTRLTALSILGRRKVYQKIENGEVLDEYVEYPENEQLKSIFTFIRTYAYFVMHEISERLGYQFESYNTDCVYYRVTVENRKLVSSYLDEQRLLYKWLTYTSDEETSE